MEEKNNSFLCDDFRAVVSAHLSKCETCRNSLSTALNFLDELPFLDSLLKRFGFTKQTLRQTIEGFNNG